MTTATPPRRLSGGVGAAAVEAACRRAGSEPDKYLAGRADGACSAPVSQPKRIQSTSSANKSKTSPSTNSSKTATAQITSTKFHRLPSSSSGKQARSSPPSSSAKPSQQIRSQRNRALLERVALNKEARASSCSSQQARPQEEAPVGVRSPTSASFGKRRSESATGKTLLVSTVKTPREPPASVTNSRLRQGALYARRHQYRMSGSEGAAQAPTQSTTSTAARLSLPAPRPSVTSSGLLFPASKKTDQSLLVLKMVSANGGRASMNGSDKREGYLLSGTSAARNVVGEFEMNKSSEHARKLPHTQHVATGQHNNATLNNHPSTSPATKQDHDFHTSHDKHQQTLLIDENNSIEASSPKEKSNSPRERHPKQGSERFAKSNFASKLTPAGAIPSDNKLNFNLHSQELNSKVKSSRGGSPENRSRSSISSIGNIEDKENLQMILVDNNNIQRSRSSLGSSHNSLQSSSDEQMMILGSPLVTPPPSEAEDLELAGYQADQTVKKLVTSLTKQSDEQNKENLPESPSNKLQEQQFSKRQKKSLAEISIRQEPITDFYEVDSRPFARGKFAQVKRCVNKLSGQSFAAKCIKKRRRLVDIRGEILLEIEALKLSYYSERIIKLYEVFETSTDMILILEMANGGELQRVLDEEEALSELVVKRMVKQILDGLILLHENDIAHLDIKPQNLLLTEPFPNGDIKLCDFGISRRITKDCEIRDICGTPDYVAPEILRYDPISLATDMWSLGVLVYVLLSGYSPFGSDNKQQTFCNITQATLEFPSDIFDTNEISQDAIDFIRKLIVREPIERLTSREARNHSWLINE